MSEMIDLWTFQHPSVIQRLKEEGTFAVDPTRVDSDHGRAYQWLVKQMELRIPGYPVGRFPIWAWTHKPQLDKDLHESCAGDALIHMRIPRVQVLVSDYDFWHCVLNNGPVALTDQEIEEAWASWSQRQIEESWSRIFDIELIGPGILKWIGSPWYRPLQATFAEIRVSNIVSIDM